MSRIPTMTEIEARAAIGAERGQLASVNFDNRSTLRKWFVARGMAALDAAKLSSAELMAGYNSEAEYSRIVETPRRDVPNLSNPPAFMAMPNGNGHAAPSSNDPQDTTALISTLRALIGASVDESKVRAIVAETMGELDHRIDNRLTETETRSLIAEMLSSIAAPTRIEVSTNGAPAVQLQGAVHKDVPDLIKIVSAGLNVCLVGPAGSGKTTACEQVAKALNRPFFFSGQMTGAHELTGFVDGHGRYQTTPFRQAFEHGGVFLCDEVDGSDPAVPNTLNAALANGHMSFPDRAEPVSRHPDFICVAAANTYGRGADRLYVGRNQLDAAFLDRFVFVSFDYDETLEASIAGNPDWTKHVQKLRAGATKIGARVVISPRASINGAKLLAAGLAWPLVEEMAIWKGVDQGTRDKITSAAANDL
jgi:hypothetical protein